ncbi:MAG: hydroxymethylbilane synthase [Clostridium sp.]|uniref:hydroxymethylbilane synthase n=1 Tax=Clostridium sp. DSM 8431 TaxID=1761781 RepID=UPI0008E33D20|nr:hydroxymethylbilane synthase [Clostridium sp. DSM 8431]MCR4943704.1 hydroxymethylbilane synthase [Clostridium sp.]SFU42310.1 hydroxymethylbilane synthase [Clostridium sp. DSM 8431]
MEIIIATRKSILAQIQADYVGGLISESKENTYKKLLVVTEGDKRLDVTLDKIGGKGLFTKEVELALLNKEAHAAVHSMKDVPFDLISEFEITAIPKREDVRDVFVSNSDIHFEELRKGAKVGTSSIRRGALLKQLRPDLEIVPIRGNVQTRFKKMEEQNLDGMILAAAGLKRLNMEDKITDYFDPKVFLPAVGQGALGVETLKNFEHKDIFKAIDDEDARICVEAERSFMKSLNGDCHSLIGVYSTLSGSDLYLVGTYEYNGEIVKKDILGSRENHLELGEALGQKIKRRI